MDSKNNFLFENLNEETKSYLNSILDFNDYVISDGNLYVPFGVTEEGKTLLQDVSEIPHILVSGTTGSGKTAFIRSLMCMLMFQYLPEKIRFMMFDSNAVDYTAFNSSPYMLVPVTSNPQRVSGMISWLHTETLERIRKVQLGFSLEEKPEIFFILDDYAHCLSDEDMTKKLFKVLSVGRIAKVHCIISTSASSAKIVPTELKANIPCRISFHTATKMDSRIILDMHGAEGLTFPGEMICKTYGNVVKCKAIHIIDEYINAMMKTLDDLRDKYQPNYEMSSTDQILREIDIAACGEISNIELGTMKSSDYLPKAIEVVVDTQSASTTLLQRKLKLGYAQAARIIDELEERGIIGPYEGAKPRKVLVTKQQWLEMNALAKGGIDVKYTGASTSNTDSEMDIDPLLCVAIDVVCKYDKVTTSILQRELKIGYARATRMIDELYEFGVVGSYNGVFPRKVIISHDQADKLKKQIKNKEVPTEIEATCDTTEYEQIVFDENAFWDNFNKLTQTGEILKAILLLKTGLTKTSDDIKINEEIKRLQAQLKSTTFFHIDALHRFRPTQLIATKGKLILFGEKLFFQSKTRNIVINISQIINFTAVQSLLYSGENYARIEPNCIRITYLDAVTNESKHIDMQIHNAKSNCVILNSILNEIKSSLN